MKNINFEIQTKYGKFSDALVFGDDEILPDDAESEILKQQRLANWIAIIENPVVDTGQG